MRKVLSTIIFLLSIATVANAQLTPSSSVVSVRPVLDRENYQPGDSYQLLVELTFKDGWHSQSRTPSQKGLIATELKLTAGSGITVGRILYPPGKMTEFAFSEEPLSTYNGVTWLGTTIALPPELADGDYTIAASLTVQNCDDKSCLMPSTIDIPITIKVAGQGSGEKINKKIFVAATSLFESDGLGQAGASGSDEIGDYLSSQGLLLTYLFIFLGGLALNLTPCVYPLIPITVSYFGGQSEKKRGHLFVHAFLYLMGMAVMYSALGVFAALTGSLFGALLQHWAVTILIAATLFVLALSMFGFYDIRMPSVLADMGGKSRQGFFGTFLMGITVGIIAAPCIGPFVLGLLTFVGEKQDPFLGFTMFFVLALGLGIPFVILALFSGSVSKLPRSGLWMIWVKQVFGVILIGMALYFLEPLLPHTTHLVIVGLFLMGAGLYLGLLSKVKAASVRFKVTKGVVAIVLIGLGITTLVPLTVGPKPTIDWQKGTFEALDLAKADGRSVIVDFTAEWCLPCKELDHFTFSDEHVVRHSVDFVTLRVDLTKTGNPVAEAVKKRFEVVGVPTVLFIDETGKERRELRVIGFVDADDFYKRMVSLVPERAEFVAPAK